MGRYCMHCGAMINEGDKFCQNCGASNFEEKETVKEVEEVVTTQNYEVQNNNNYNTQSTQTQGQVTKTNGLAIASMVCSIVGLFIATIFLGIIGLCLGISAKRKIEVFNEKGKGMATAGFVIGIIDIALGIIVLIGRIAVGSFLGIF